MSRLNLLEKGKSYTFRSYFEMFYEIDDILSEFGFAYRTQKLTLPKAKVPSEVVESLKAKLERDLQVVLLTSEAARREILVAPILTEVVQLSESQIRIEYPLRVDDFLKGKLDYLLRGKQSVVVIEAKNDDLGRGFTQLAIELIALSRVETEQKMIYGAVTVGNSWVFGCLDVEKQQITQDISPYSVPTNLQDVMEALTGLLTANQLVTA